MCCEEREDAQRLRRQINRQPVSPELVALGVQFKQVELDQRFVPCVGGHKPLQAKLAVIAPTYQRLGESLLELILLVKLLILGEIRCSCGLMENSVDDLLRSRILASPGRDARARGAVMTKLSWTILALLAGSFCFPMKSARAQQISGATIIGEQTSLTLPAGKSIYLYGATNGGAYSDSGFAQGSYQTVVDTDGNVSAALAMTTSNSNTFTTTDQYYVIGGLGVTGFSNMAESYGSNTQSGASTASDTFTATNELSLVVFIGLASSQQSISRSGIPGLHVDATSSEPDAMIIAHADPATWNIYSNGAQRGHSSRSRSAQYGGSHRRVRFYS